MPETRRVTREPPLMREECAHLRSEISKLGPNDRSRYFWNAHFTETDHDAPAMQVVRRCPPLQYLCSPYSTCRIWVLHSKIMKNDSDIPTKMYPNNRPSGPPAEISESVDI